MTSTECDRIFATFWLILQALEAGDVPFRVRKVIVEIMSAHQQTLIESMMPRDTMN